MKKKLGSVNVLYPTTTTLVGAMVNGKPNFITIAHVGIMTHRTPNCISLGMNKMHYTNGGIKENKTFSVNIPSEGLVKETDYCGLVSGKSTDKSALFTIFYGELGSAPMIGECLLNMECRLYQVVDFPENDIFIGEIIQTYAEEDMLSDGGVDLAKLKPLLFDMSSMKYWSIGTPIARCWNVGKELKKK